MGTRKKKSTAPIVCMGPPADTAWIRYCTGFEAPDPVFAVCSARRVDMLVSPLEAGRAARCAATRRGVFIHTPQTLGVSGGDLEPYTAVRALLRMLHVPCVRIGPMFPAHPARCMEKDGIEVRVETGPLIPRREVKTANEVRCIGEAQRAAVRAMRAAVHMIRQARIDRRGRLRHGAGVLTSEAVRHRIAHVLRESGCRESGTVVAGGRQAVDPHARGEGPLCAGEAIVLDIFPQHERSGYWGDLTRTVARGRVSDRLGHMYAAVKAAQASALRTIAPRKAFRSVHAAACAELERRGFRTGLDSTEPEGFIHGTGHGVGLEIHEAPSLRNVAGRLKAGHVVTVEPGLYYRADGGIRIEDTVVVTERGARILAPMERIFCLDA